VATGQAQWTVEVGVPVWSAGLLPSGQAVVVGTHDGTLLALAAADGTERGRARVGTSVVRSVAVADGRVVAGDDTGTVWVVTTSPERGVDDDAHAIYQGAGSVWTVAAADGGTVLTGWTDGVVRRVDGAGLVDTYAAHAGPIRSIAYDQRSGWFAATGDDGLVSRWSMTGGSLLVDQRTTSTADLVGAADRSGRIYVGGTDQRLSVLAAGGTALEPLGQPLGAPIDDIAVSPDGTVVAVGLLGGEVRAISTATGGVLATVSTGGPAAFVALSGDHLVAVGERAWVVDLSTDDRREIPVPADLTVAALAAADDGAEVVLGGGAGDRGAGLVRWSEQDGPTSAYFGSAGLVINAIDLDPAGRRVVIGRNDGRTEIWQIDPLAATGIGFNQHTREIYDVGFAAGGTRVVSLDGGGQVWTWSATYGTSLALALPAELDLARTLLLDDAGVDVTIVGRGGVTEARLDADHVRQLACELAPSVCS